MLQIGTYIIRYKYLFYFNKNNFPEMHDLNGKELNGHQVVVAPQDDVIDVKKYVFLFLRNFVLVLYWH